MNIHALLISRFSEALTSMGISDAPVPVARSGRPEFGEYQFNGAMALAKTLKQKPRDIAQQILEQVKLDDVASKLEIAGPGFINIHLRDDWLAVQCNAALDDARVGIPAQQPQTIVVDYSSPNLAKEMHVGHLRTTIIGDAVVKLLEFLGHKVIRQNHMGDWGTQFGMLLAHLSDKLSHNEVAETALSDLEDFYREAKVRFDEEDGFADRAREYVVKLQGGDAQCLALWKQFIDVSISHSEEVYDKLNVSLTRKDIMGESAYNDDLANVVAELKEKGIAVEDQGAQVVFIPELADKEGNPAVYIVQKSGGGYLYATTDLAAMRYRSGTLNADRTLILTDARQALHFKQTEIVGRKAGFMKPEQSYEHCPFGMMLGSDGKPFKTRSGGTVKLVELLDEAVERAAKLLAQRDTELSADELNAVARKVGIGAVKYADLSKNRTTDYMFNWDTMLSFEGNTAPYLQYAFTRVQSLFRKADVAPTQLSQAIHIEHHQEHALAVQLLQFEEQLAVVARDATPHVLCSYLYDLASHFMSFYEACPILKDDVDSNTRQSRLALSALVAKQLKLGLDLLGIETLDKM
ncbi:MAG: arginine--tRNA ligase [Aestuariibacter sp.]|nr:arginine--tRNA ligase [Marisediminitalea aggregata]MCP3862758.1 arginine--tRNA ligase [Aestuariibacter sp.]MCP4235778.1 arginine--tRNA ligase [Aestuariibacter sp.]MCP4528111.1 arginine--tRNA ligase [Aestuariibacter sp.]MCP4948096.1 arginine--tRNA ligase [Aestuariibacter sp.]MCP5010272.1 arginine--tRNA ligase [Aestuariibacter sp.]